MGLQKPRKNSRYKTGAHVSPKCVRPFEYRSGWELLVAQALDADPDVVVYAYEAVGVPFVTNPRSGRVRKYFPDFLVQYRSGRRLIIEVKRDDKAKAFTVLAKAKACSSWAAASGVDYEIWTSKEIQTLRGRLGLSTKMTVPRQNSYKPRTQRPQPKKKSA